MATTTRTVSIKLQLDGYNEYRNTISALNAQNRLLDAQLKEIDIQYGKNSTSVTAMTEKQKLLKEQLEVQVAKYKETNGMLQQSVQQEQYYKDAMDKKALALGEARKNLELYNAGAYKGKKTEEELKKEVSETTLAYNAAAKEYSTSANETARLVKERAGEEQAIKDILKLLKDEVSLKGSLREIGKQISDDWKDLVEDADTLKNSLSGVQTALTDSVKASTNYETAFAGVRKTVDESKVDLDELSDSIKEMSLNLPFTTTEIAKIAEIAGQLGVDNSAEEIAHFSEVVLGLGASTNLTSENAAEMLAQFKNINDFTKGEGLEGYDKFASTLVELGNNTATTEKDILEMAQRFSSAGTLAGLSAPQILGMSAALSSVGIRAEAGGTSLTKLTQKIQTEVETNGKKLKDFAKVAGVSSDEFAKAWGEDPVKAIQMFLGGLHDTYEEGDSILPLLDELGLKEVRLRNAVMSLASGEKDLAYYVDMANKAWGDNTALQTEVSKRYSTTESKQKELNNAIEIMKIEVGDALVPVLADAMTHLKDIITPITEWIKENPELVRTIAEVVGVLVVATTGINAMQTAISAVSSAFSILTNPLTLVIGGLGLLVSAVIEASEKSKVLEGDISRFGEVASSTKDVIGDSTRAYADQQKAIEDTIKEADEYISVLQNCEHDGKITRDEQEKYNDAIEHLKELFPDLNIEIDKHTGMIKGGVSALKDEIKAWKERALAEASQEKLVKLYKQQLDAQEELAKNNKLWKDTKRDIEETEKTLKGYKDRQKELEDLMNGMSSDDQMWGIYMQEWTDLELKIGDTEDTLHGYMQTQADLEVAMKGDKDAIVETQTAINNWNKAIEGATKATDDNTTANNENAKSYDQSETATRNGRKTIKAYVDGQIKYFTTDEWKAYQSTIKSNTNKAMDDAGADAKKKGKEVTSDFAEGMNSNSSAIKNAFKGIVSNMDFKVTVSQTSASTFAAKIKPKFAEGGIVTREMDAIVGEAGAEAIMPLDKLPEIMNKAMAQNNYSMERYGNNSRSELSNITYMLSRYLPKMSNMQVVMDGNRLVGTLAPKLDNYYANEQFANERGM